MGSIIVKDPKFYKNLLLLAVPIIMQNLISISVGICDNMMVGSLGEIAIAGVSLANQIQNLMFMLLLGISAATTLLAAQYWGKGDIDSIKLIIGIGMKIALLVGFIVSCLTFSFPEAALSIFTNEPEVIVEGAKFLKILSFSFCFFCVTNVLVASLRSVEVVGISLIISISTLIIVIILNYLLIFGNFGFPQMGIRGSAVATLVARIIECGIIIFYVRFKDTKLNLRLKDLLKTDRQLLKDYFVYGFPVMIGDVCWGIGGAAQAAIIGRLGAEAIAANSIALIFFSFVTVVVFGISGASAIIIGKTVGAKRYDEVKLYAKTLQLIFFACGLLTSVVILLTKGYFVSFYNIADTTKVLADQFIFILAITVIGTSYHAPCFTGIIRAGGDTRFVLIVDLIFVWCVVLPLSYLAAFVFVWPPAYVFLCLKCDQLMKWVIAFIKTNRFTWIKNLTR